LEHLEGGGQNRGKLNWTAQPAEVIFDFLVGLAYLIPAIKLIAIIAI
jgi:hypothetical protein